jgi:hypothetical protein
MTNYTRIDVPFDARHRCWFCGEPSDSDLNFPLCKTQTTHLSHAPLSVPSCQECRGIARGSAFKKGNCNSISDFRDAVKRVLVTKYQKVLAIGSNWTEQELVESDLEGAAFEGFKHSAWMMYSIAQERVNYPGWPLSLAGVPMYVQTGNVGFEFDGTHFSDLETATDHYIKTFYLDARLLRDMVKLVGQQRFAYAIRICRLYPVVTADERQVILKDIADNQREEQYL